MDDSETEVDVIDLTLDDDVDLEPFLAVKAADSDDCAFDGSRRRGSCEATRHDAGQGEEAAEDDDDIYSVETLPASLSRAETVLGHKGADEGRLSGFARMSEEEEEGGAATGTRAGNDDLVLAAEAAEAASSPSPSKAHGRHAEDVEPSVGADVAGEDPLFPWIAPFQFDKGQVTVREIPGDGHCLYRSCLHQRRDAGRSLPTDAEVHRLRGDVAAYMRRHQDRFGVFFPDRHSLDASITTVEKGGWGDSVSISAIANMWRCLIEVYMEMGSVIRHQPDDGDDDAPDSVPVLRVAYRFVEDDGNIVYNHFDSVVAVVLDEHCSPATTVAVTRSPSSASPASACPSPRGGSSTARRKTAAARSPHRSPARSAKRRCDRGGPGGPAAFPAATSTPSATTDSAYRSNSQDLVDPASPSPALSPPGRPDDECVSASQETLKAKHAKEALAGRGAKRPSRRPSETSSGGDWGRTRLAPLMTTKDPSLADLSSGPAPGQAMDLDLLSEPELNSVQKTTEWVSKVWDLDLDVDTVVAAFASSPDVTRDTVPDDTRENVSDDAEIDVCLRDSRHEISVCDVEACFNTIEVCGIVVRSYGDVTTSCPRLVTKTGNPVTSRTISTNVHLSNSKLVGTFQVLY